MKKLLIIAMLFPWGIVAQNSVTKHHWQQEVDYTMSIDMDVEKFQFIGDQTLVYTNNSLDTLHRVYYHLYFNAFQPGSAMDARLQTIADPDRRMVKTFRSPNAVVHESRIQKLTPDQIGYLKINRMQQEGKNLNTKVVGTILEVDLDKPILPNSSTTLTMNFTGQVPEQIRRSGRNSNEGVALSMTQWYPKICVFDYEGWHADPYIGREFYGNFGKFDVKITIDKNYTIGGTGVLQNKNQIGHGYQDANVVVEHPKRTKKLTWHFVADRVHDFAWAADPNYIHDKLIGEGGVELHFLYKNDPEIIDNWKELPNKTNELLKYFNRHIGTYPYPQYTVAQGGDGGMEYAMCTLITGKRSLPSLVGVTAHELAHIWFQHVLATNELKYEWMDEGFTTYISDLAMDEIMPNKNRKEQQHAFEDSYASYRRMVASGKEQPQTTHADRYELNSVYGASSYSKGAIFLAQLIYIVGQENLDKSIKRFYHDFKFKHPTPNDFKRTVERVTGANLDWYLTDWTQTTNTIDYGIKDISEEGIITIQRIGLMPMPIEVLVEYKDGSEELYYASNTMMRWNKPHTGSLKRIVLEPWDWAIPNLKIETQRQLKDIKKVTIDPSGLLADVNLDNNHYIVQ